MGDNVNDAERKSSGAADRSNVNQQRRNFLTAATCVVGAGGVVGLAVPFLGSWAPSARAKAAGAPVKANISKLEPGEMVTVEWRGKPVFVVRRTVAQLASLPGLNTVLKDAGSADSKQPEYIKGESRAIKDEYFVVVGLCTHLGCAPKFRPEVGAPDMGAAWQGGFFCPCHGSKFDLAGRVYKGSPASANLEVPKYHFEGDNVLVVGISPGDSA